MSGSGGISFRDIVNGVDRTLPQHSIAQADQYFNYGSMNGTVGQKTQYMLLKHYNKLLELFNAEPNKLDVVQRAELLSLLATHCDFALSVEERKYYGRQCIAGCLEVAEFDDKGQAVGQTRRDMEELLASLDVKKGVENEMGEKDRRSLNDSDEDDKNGHDIPVRSKDDKNNDDIGLWEEEDESN